MAIRIVRLGTPIKPEEGLRLHRSLLGRMLRDHGAEVIEE